VQRRQRHEEGRTEDIHHNGRVVVVYGTPPPDEILLEGWFELVDKSLVMVVSTKRRNMRDFWTAKLLEGRSSGNHAEEAEEDEDKQNDVVTKERCH